jgi:hypothetical protein
MLDRPNGSKPTSPAIDQSRSGGRLRKGRAALFLAYNDDDDVDLDVAVSVDAQGATKADAVPTRRVAARVVDVITFMIIVEERVYDMDRGNVRFCYLNNCLPCWCCC